MKYLFLIIGLTLTQNSLAVGLDELLLFPGGSVGNPELVPVKEDPGPNAEVIEQLIHDKVIEVDGAELSVKWTELGYGSITQKIIVPELARHTLFDHRNPGEEGPCLRSFAVFGAPNPTIPEVVEIDIQISNLYRIDRDRKICQVSMVEDVRTVVEGIEFSHRYTKDMGFRYIEDCL